MVRKKIMSMLIMTAFVLCMIFGTGFVSSADADTFYVQGRYLYDFEGNRVILVGANAMLIYWDQLGNQTYPNLEATGANVCRIFWNVDPNVTPWAFDMALQNCIDHNMIPMPSVWNATGNWSNLDMCVDWWLSPEILPIVKKHQQYLLLNIANEAGDYSVSKSTWENKYKEIITRFRNAGVYCPLVIDAAGWGRDETYFLERGQNLVNHDPYHNIIFSWHPWDVNQPRSRYENALNQAISKNLCVIVGEFSHIGATYEGPCDWVAIIEECNERNIGWLPWVWRGASSDDQHNITTNYATYTSWGRQVVPYITSTAVRPPFLGGGGGDTQPPTAPTNLRMTGKTSSSISLAWNPSTDDVGVAGYQVFRNGNMIDTTTGTAYTDTGLSPGTTYSYYVKAYDTAGNTSNPSNTINVTTDPPGGGISYSEDFNDNQAQGWTLSQYFSVTSGKLTGGDWYSIQINTYDGAVFSGDYVYKADFYTGGAGTDWNNTRILFNYTNSSNYYFVSFGNSASTGEVSLGKVVNGSSSIIATYGSYIVAGRPTTVEVIYENGGDITVKATQSSTTTTLFNKVRDTTFTSGKIGLCTHSTYSEFDNVYVYSPDSQDVLEIDGFETYSSDSQLQSTYVRVSHGNSVTVYRDSNNKNAGNYGMRYNYTIGSPNYCGVSRNLGNADWSGYTGIRFWFKPDGSNRTLTVQFKEGSGEFWETYHTISGTSASVVSLPFSSFVNPPWGGRVNGVLELGQIAELSIYVNQGSGSTGTSNIYFDSIELYK